MHQQRVNAVGNHVKSLSTKIARPLLVAGEKAWRFAVLLARHDQAIDGGMEFWVVEFSGDADEVGQIVVTKPDHVDAVDRRDRLDVLDACCGLDQRDRHRARVRLGDLVVSGPSE